MRDPVELGDGAVIHASWPLAAGLGSMQFPLIIADPPYGKIVNEPWDHRHGLSCTLVNEQLDQINACAKHSVDGGALYWFGGYGTPGYRPFYHLASVVEKYTLYQIAAHITWSKKRAYGVQHNYLSTREEILYLIKGDIKKPACFSVPYTDIERGYEGYNKDYPAKSKFKRRTMVWDISEIFKGKLHPCEKPQELLKIMIETNTNPGDWVLDLFSGSGATSLAARSLGRKFLAIEESEEWFDLIVERLK